MITVCNYYKQCEAPLCPMATREENLDVSKIWQVSMPICRLEMNVPFWVKQQRKIVDQIKHINSFTCFTLIMLEAPLKITGNVKGVHLESGICIDSALIQWFRNNELSVPYEITDQLIIQSEKRLNQTKTNSGSKILSLAELKKDKDPTIN